MNRSLFVIAISGAVLALALGAQACSSDEAAAPSRPPTPTPTTSSGGTGGGEADGGGEGGAADCFDGTKAKPSDAKQFLNQCNGAGCFPFDNTTRIEGWTPGAPLPALN